MNPVRLGVIGIGYWGPNLVRNFVELPSVEVIAAADINSVRLDQLSRRFPQVKHTTIDHRDLFQLGLDAVVVSTPPETHAPIVTEALENDLHVLVEKPLATRSDDIRRLMALADSRQRVLMVGHTFEYNPAVRALKQMIDEGALGTIRYIDAVRVGLGLFHPTLNVVWDLAPHDISILINLLGESPFSVSTRGIACVQDSIEDVAYMTLMFPSGILAHIRMSWLDPCKTRRITVVGSKQMAVYDDVEAQEKIKLYDKSVSPIRRTETFGEFQFSYHYGNVVSPYVHFEEPLRIECAHFIECIEEGRRPLTDGASGLRVVEVIEAAQRSLRAGGSPMLVADGTQPVHDWSEDLAMVVE